MKKNTFRLAFVLVLSLILSSNLTSNAQGKISVSPSLTSRHYWRGIMVSNTANIEVDMAYTNKNFTFGAWGGYGLENTYSEFDFHVGYKFNEYVDIAVWDLFANRDRATINDYNYFDFNSKTTNHLIDATINVNFGESFPLTASWSTMLYGRDLNAKGKQNYSSYLELGYPVEIGGKNISFFAGMNMFKERVYGQSVGFVNIGASISQDIKISDNYSVCTWAKIAINPQAETANLIFGVNF